MNRSFQHSSADTASCATLRRLLSVTLGLALVFAFGGCAAPNSTAPTQRDVKQSEAETIREADVLKISFPGAPNLDTTQAVRRDGRITLELVGEVLVTGMTPGELEQHLIQLYSTQLVSKEVTVTIISSSYSVFVTGAVIRPGKLQPDHPMTALEAIREAGGFDAAEANMEAVVVRRQENGGTKNYTLNLKKVFDGESSESFYLRPSDILYVPEKFTWF
jgi:polysaccharide biosynthesis/export protein